MAVVIFCAMFVFLGVGYYLLTREPKSKGKV